RHGEKECFLRPVREAQVECRNASEPEQAHCRRGPCQPASSSPSIESLTHFPLCFSRPDAMERARAPQRPDRRRGGRGRPLPGWVNPVPRSGERIAPLRGESRSVRLRLAALVVWLALAAACLAVFGVTVEAIVNVLGCAVVVAVAVTDLERRIVPNRIVLPALAVALVVQTIRDPSVEWLLSAL